MEKEYGHEKISEQIEISEYFKAYINMLVDYRKDPSRADEEGEMLRMYYDAVNGYSPDLNSLPQLDMYILRYATANFLEYMVLYDIALQKLNSRQRIASVSFGSGSGIDGLSLAFAAQYYNISKNNLVYMGVDPVKWQRRFIIPKEYIGNTLFFNEGMEDFFSEKTSYYKLCKIFLFAKVLSEDYNTEKLENTIVNAMQSYPYDEVMVCFSIRNKNCFTDFEASDRVIRAFIKGMGGIDQCNTDCTFRSTAEKASQKKIREAIEYQEREIEVEGKTIRADLITFNNCMPESYSDRERKPINLVHPRFRISTELSDFFSWLRDRGMVSPNGDELYPSSNVDPMCIRLMHITRKRSDDDMQIEL